jgi:hypothetical protein
MQAPRKLFARPWRVVEKPESFCIMDAGEQPLAFVYFEDEAGRARSMKRMSKDEARRLAAQIVRLTDLLQEPEAAQSLAGRAGVRDQALACQPLMTGWRSSPAGVKPRYSISATTGAPTLRDARMPRASFALKPEPAQPHGTSSLPTRRATRTEPSEKAPRWSDPITAKCSVIVHFALRQASDRPDR